MLPKLLLAVSLIALGVCVVSAQEVTGSLEGRVIDSLGTPIPGVSIAVTGTNLQGVRGTTSDPRGYFRVLALPVGSFTIRISHVAYQQVTYENVPVRLGKTNSLGEFRLASQTVILEPVTISGSKPLIDATSTTTGANIGASTFEPLPMDRSLRSIVTLAPGANGSHYIGEESNISGGTGNDNIYFIDGINVTEPIRSSTSSSLPYNLVREVEVKTGGYEPEYSSALGGVVNVVTQSGSNEFRGQAFGFFTNNGLTAQRKPSFLGETVNSFSAYDIGLSFGGPIIADRLWFYAAYNPSVENKDVTLPGLSTYPDKKQTHLFAGKINWSAGEKTQVMLSVLGDPGTQDAVVFNSLFGTPIGNILANPDPLLQRKEKGGVNVSLQANHSLNDKILLEVSGARFDRTDNTLPLTEIGWNETLFTDVATGVTSGGLGGTQKAHSVRWSARVDATFFLGMHTVKTGINYEDNALDNEWRWLSGENGEKPGIITKIDDTTYFVGVGYQTGKVGNRIPAAFVQDSWLVNDRLRLNAGVRVTNQYLIGTDGSVSQKITGEVQPRLGITYQMGDEGSQKVFGSYGRFFEQIPLLFSYYYTNNIAEAVGVMYDHDPRLDPSGGDTIGGYTGSYPEVQGLQGQYFDEFSLGYERRFGREFKIGVRGTYRNLLQAVEDAMDLNTGVWHAGNPGSGNLAFLPRLTRQYRAIEVTLERNSPDGINILASYVLSRTHGNYPGLYSGDYGDGNLNAGQTNLSPSVDGVDQFVYADGPLPNDRTHVFKISGSCPIGSHLSLGTSFFIQSGVPLNEFGSSATTGVLLLEQRGSLGRTPVTWDLNLRAAYSLPLLSSGNLRPKLILDVFHVFSQRTAVIYDQYKYLAQDGNGNQIGLNPTYGQAKFYQPPMSVRLGMEVNF